MATTTTKIALTVEEAGRRGGKARLTTMTAEDRTRIARLAAQARWAKKADAPDPTDPKGPKRDEQVRRPGILSTRKSCRPAGVSVNQPMLFEFVEAA